MPLRFRNLDVTPADPVEQWGPEGILTALERGGLPEWQRIVAAVRRDPDGPVVEDVREALSMSQSTGVNAAVADAVSQVLDPDGWEVRRRVRAAVRCSGLTARDLADRVGTSASRLSTYASGKVVPSAAMLVRIERVAQEATD